ncbi:MAG TPA: hypothetical protein VMF59_04830 [Bacteroidota bacterium]|nr:hypothetical protein [Bacteroidota bacterium]
MKRPFLACALPLAACCFWAASPAQPERPSGDRTSVDLTIYNQNLSLIREERTFLLGKGITTVVVPDVPSTIDGTSVHYLSLTDPEGVRVLEQNYQYDLVHQARLLERYIGKEVDFIRTDPSTNKEYTVAGRLLSTGFVQQPGYANAYAYAGTGGMIAEINGKIEIAPAGRLVLPSLPEGLVLKPRLQWIVSSDREGNHRSEVSYLAGGLSWSADYVVLLDRADASLDLTGWVTLVNGSGTTFRNAGLKLVAGDVNVVQNQLAGMMKAQRSEALADAAAPQFRQSSLFEYKLYTLGRKTDLADNETKQIELTSGRGVPAQKTFIYDGLGDEWRSWFHNYSYRGQASFGQQSNPKVGVFVTFRNSKDGGLGMPLPKGKVRVYKRDDDGKEQFIGEDQIDHTPKDEQVRLYLGNAFDLVGERVQKDFKTYASGRVVEETFEITVRNHKDAPADVQVYEHPWRWAQWEIIGANGRWSKVDQSTLTFPLHIEQNGEKTVKYTIRYSWQ